MWCEMPLSKFMRTVVRKSGAGRFYTREIRPLRQRGLWKTWVVHTRKKHYLQALLLADPIESRPDGLEAHMLLSHARLTAGLWAFYSLARQSQRALSIVVHDDGSLTAHDVKCFARVFPNFKLITRDESDRRLANVFATQGLPRCAQLRRSLVFGLKLFDPMIFAEQHRLIILDSDVLFFSCPSEIIDYLSFDDAVLPPRYSPDVRDQYCLNDEEMREVLGQPCIARFNPGVMCASVDTLVLPRIESYLGHPKFWLPGGAANYYAELTIWAMELTHQKAIMLSDDYALVPTDFKQTGLVSGHYCGGVSSDNLYYFQALPHVASVLLQ